jgi:hypothetical protein
VDAQAGLLVVKILERKAALLGLDQPVQSRIDVYQAQTEQQPSSFERLHEMITRIARQGREGNGDGDGAVSVLSNSGDDEPNH